MNHRVGVMHWGHREAPAPVIVAVGACNGLGFSAYQTWAFRRAEATAFSETPFRGRSGERTSMVTMRSLPPRAVGAERLTLIGRRALQPVLAALEVLPASARVALILALPERFAPGNDPVFVSQGRALEEALADEVSARGFDPLVHVEPRGHAAWAFAVAEAGAALIARQLDAAIVGGVDSYYDPDVVDLWVGRRRLFDGENLDSFIPGEGGAFVLLAPRDVVKTTRWTALGRIEGTSMELETASPSGDAPSMALGLTRAIEPLHDRLVAERRLIDWWLADATGEADRTHELQLALPRVSGGVTNPSTVLDLLPPLLGDLGAATMPTAAAIAIEGCWRGDPLARTCLISGSSVGPERGAVLLASENP